MTGYLLSLAVWIPASGWIGDRYGTKRTFLVALGVFMLGSALCGVSWDSGSLIAFRIHGVNPAYIQQMKDLGFDNLSADDLTAFKIHGVTPAFVQMMRPVIRGKLSADDLTALKIHGVSPEYIKGLEAIGYTNLNAEQLTGFRIHGVTPAFVGTVKDAGYPRVTPDQLIELRIHGVTPEFIQNRLLTPLYLIAEPFAWFIPAGRFPGLVASGVAGARLATGQRSGR